ncbi:MAG: lipid A export ATP-binding/permease MsbA, partial [Alphaproteobacteria bacterium]|nr:lipid A export ATP-binding/permease MsbA [Alphaproteobacteria bacterium]
MRERRILDALSALRNRMTIVPITHRPSIVGKADHRVILERGRVIAE